MDISPGSMQKEAEPWTTPFGLSAPANYLRRQFLGPNAELCSSATSLCFDSTFTLNSIADGNAEHLWASQGQTPLDARNVPQQSVLPEFEFNGDCGLHSLYAVHTADINGALLANTHIRLLEPNLPIPLDGVPASVTPPYDQKSFGISDFSFSEGNFGLPLKNAESSIPDLSLSTLGAFDDHQTISSEFYSQQDVCHHPEYTAANQTGLHAPEIASRSLPASRRIPRSAEYDASFVGPSILDWDSTDVELGRLPTPEVIPMLNNSYTLGPNTLLPENPAKQVEFPSLNASVESDGTRRYERKKHRESLKRTRAQRLKRTLPKLDDFLFQFDINSESNSGKRTRKTFSIEERNKISGVRKIHACVSCKSRKISCSISGVCEHCLKAANDPLLAKQICLRTKLKDTFIGVKDIYGSLNARRGDLEPILRSMIGSPVQVTLSVICSSEKVSRVAELPLEVRGCSASPKGLWKSLGKAKGIYLTYDSVYDQRYVIVPSSLPSLDEVDQFGRKILSLSDGSHSGNITRLLDDFLLTYCRQGHLSPLRRFSDSTVRVVGLNGLVSHNFLNIRDGSYKLLERSSFEDSEDRNFVSPTVNDQIRLLAADGLKPSEDFLFAEIDRLGKIVGSSKHARMVAGICIMRLLLLYRDRAVRDEIRLSLPRQKLIHRTRLDQSIFMYKRLTIAYGTLCRENDSPLISVYESEPTTEANGLDTELRASFLQLRPAYHDFCSNLTQKHDDVFKLLIPRLAGKDSICTSERKLSKNHR